MTPTLLSLAALVLLVQSGPIAPEGAAADHILSADPATARMWLSRTEEPEPAKALPGVLGEPLSGVDEADIIALHVVLSGISIAQASPLPPVFQHGHHGVLVRIPGPMVQALARGTASSRLLSRVRRLAATFRGKPKSADWVQLSVTDLESIIRVCRSSAGRPVFIHFSE